MSDEASDAISVGSKGIMLSVRPGQGSSATTLGEAKTRTGGVSKTTAFVSTVVPPDQLGLNPLRKSYPASRATSVPSDSVIWRHKQWLNEFSARKMASEERAKMDLERKEIAKQNFRKRQEAKRASIRGVVGPATAADFTATKTISNTKPKTPAKKLPAWALTEEEAEELEEGEVDELLDFANNLDFDQYLDDMEVREALKVVQQKVEDLENKERLYAARTDYSAEKEGNEDEEAERAAVRSEREAAQKKMARLKKMLASYEDRPDWNNSVRTDDDAKVAEIALEENKALSKVHSRQSTQKIMEQMRAQTPIQPMMGQAVVLPNPTISVVDAQTGAPRKTRASNLPFLYRHPAI